MDTPRLTIELVPASSWFDNVRSRVTKEKWDALRRLAYKAAGYRCEICGGRGEQWPVECHERWLYDDGALIQRLDGLIALCPSCHEVKHFGLAMKQGRFAFAQAHLENVNGWDRHTSNVYIMRAFEQWETRSKHDWRLDLFWLVERGVAVAVDNGANL